MIPNHVYVPLIVWNPYKIVFFFFLNYSELSVMKIKTKHMDVIMKGFSNIFFKSMFNVLRAPILLNIYLRQDFLEFALILGELKVFSFS